MRTKHLLAGAAVALTAAMAGAANAAYVYVGSWEVDQGPYWAGSPPDGPLAYTGQEAAALLFGGTASDYAISTVDANPADIDFQSWYSVIGYYGPNDGGIAYADDYSSKYLGQYYGPTSGYPFGDPTAAASAYVDDNAGFGNINYAFLATPEPGAWALMLVGVFGLGGALRAKSRARRAATA